MILLLLRGLLVGYIGFVICIMGLVIKFGLGFLEIFIRMSI